MLATLIPLFDANTTVCAYSLFTQKKNPLLNPGMLGTGSFDGAGNIEGFDLIETIGFETLAADSDIFVEVSNIAIFSDLESKCTADHKRLVLLIDPSVRPEQTYLDRIAALKKSNFKFAIKKLPIENYAEYGPVLKLMDYILINHKTMDPARAKLFFDKAYPSIKLVAVNVNSQEDYDNLVSIGSYALYEGLFFRMPVVKKKEDIAPVKINYIELLNIVNDDDFELTAAADVVGRDPALVISLLKVVNRLTISEITSVRHAAAMLGQKEFKRWINTVVTSELCADRPGEITRISLIRAKFAENLAAAFGIGGLAPELFLTGLFSVIDTILQLPMSEALGMVKVSKSIEKALTTGTGELGEVLNFIVNYENASWAEVDRQLVLKNISTEQVHAAYIDTLEWYKKLFK